MSLEKIQKRIKILEKYKEENKKSREMIKDTLESDDKYQEALETSKQAAKLKKEIKERIMEQPNMEELQWKIKENREEIKINNQILAQELSQYMQKTNSNQIEDDTGEIRTFEMSVKLSRKKNDF